ncbi:ACP S-malonyltransferase [Mycolicibacterium sp. Dal123E01]|uniref:ACP S-malonyltransferase n=1 Tax=Mycolicibacterium sp. Dal123E01 TaxID=3457578 RepID=UPI00403EE45A
MSLALLFPGQGAQRPHMLRDLPTSPAMAEVFDESGYRIGDLDTAEALRSTVDVQVALLIAGVGCVRVLRVEHGLAPQFVAGHSVGAFAAAVAAGVITFAEALAAVALRGRLMEQACAQGDWGMAAVSGVPTRTAVAIAREVGTDSDPIWVATVNSASQTVLGGTSQALRTAGEAARRAGARDYERLDIAVASHGPIQHDTARHLGEHLATLPRRTPTARYLANTTGRVAASADAVLDDLASAVAHPVQWYDATRLMGELGVTCAIETSPGHVLTGLLPSTAAPFLSIPLEGNSFAAAARRAEVHIDSPR